MSLYVKGIKMKVGSHKEVCLILIPIWNFWTFEPAVKPHQELQFFLMIATRPSALFTLNAANLFY